MTAILICLGTEIKSNDIQFNYDTCTCGGNILFRDHKHII